MRKSLLRLGGNYSRKLQTIIPDKLVPLEVRLMAGIKHMQIYQKDDNKMLQQIKKWKNFE